MSRVPANTVGAFSLPRSGLRCQGGASAALCAQEGAMTAMPDPREGTTDPTSQCGKTDEEFAKVF